MDSFVDSGLRGYQLIGHLKSLQQLIIGDARLAQLLTQTFNHLITMIDDNDDIIPDSLNNSKDFKDKFYL